MSDISEVIKVIIEKTGFKTLIFAIAVSLTANKLWINDWVWTIVLFCITYLMTNLIIWVSEYVKKRYCDYLIKIDLQQKIEKQNADNKSRMSTVFNSLPEEIKEDLIQLYKLPQEELSNIRILTTTSIENTRILNSCYNVRYKHYLLNIEESINSYIITIDEQLCSVIAEHITTTSK